ncbi:MAG: hypothetical protein KA764_03365 [Anaerolineales bacterium]|nr:hypothetical protein [Anaerolineales bacterium]
MSDAASGASLSGQEVTVGRDVAGRDIIYNVQGVDPAVLRELERQLNEFLAASTVLQHKLEEWKELHNTLHDLYIRFGTCRDAVSELGQPEAGGLGGLLGGQARRARLEKLLFGVQTNWNQCKITLADLRRLTSALKLIGPARDPQAAPDPDPVKVWERLQQAQTHIDAALNEADRQDLADALSQFGHATDEYLYQVDKALREVAKAINALPQQIRLTTRL